MPYCKKKPAQCYGQFKPALIAEICEAFAITEEQLLGRCRKQHFAWPRQILEASLYEVTRMPLLHIAEDLGRDHTSVIHSRQVVTHYRESYPNLRKQIEQLVANATKRMKGTK